MRTDHGASTGVANHLRRQIATGELAPGTPLRQEALAEQLGVSRMPVRDAIQKLSGEGLVALEPGRGAVVASMTAEECVEIFDLRVMLERDALRHAVPRHTDSSCRKLRYIQSELELAEETGPWADGDGAFHEALYSPCARPRTLNMIQTLRDAVERFYLAELRHSSHRRGWKTEHRAILKAVEERDIDAACAALDTHLRETQRVVQSRIRQLQRPLGA